MRQKKQGKRIEIIIIAVLFVAAICGFIYFLVDMWKRSHSEEVYESLRDTETETAAEVVWTPLGPDAETETEEPDIYCERIYDFEELHAQNEDIYAWITVPGTQIDYPVLQTETDNYYLNYNLDHTKGYPGCIYTNACNRKEFDDKNTVLYGHNMKNGTMFGSLHRFEDADFFEENDRIYIYTEDARLTYQIFASVKFTDVYIPAYYDVGTEEGSEAFLAAVTECADGTVSHLRREAEPRPEDTLITLSTCVNGERERRYIVVGKLIEKALYLK